MQYFAEAALGDLAGSDLMVLAGATMPVAFFAYPNTPSVLVPEGCTTFTLAERGQNSAEALEALADALGAPLAATPNAPDLPASPTGALHPGTIGASIARHMPEDTTVCDDAVTSGMPIFLATKGAKPHDWLMLTGGAIGQAIPLAVGAAVACPDRKVLSLNGDGAAMYTVQGLWTIARENLDVTVIVFANHIYRILGVELARTGAGEPGPSAASLLDLGSPRIDWISLATGLGLPAVRCDSAESFDKAFAGAMAQRGPMFIEAAL
jgi:acetolactate synthase-1/2/3 large subunit